MAVLGCDMGFSLDSASGGYSRCGERASHWGGLSCGRAGLEGAQLQGVQPTGSVRRCGSQAPERRLNCCGTRLSQPPARGMLPDQGSNPGLLHWQVGSLPRSHQERPITVFYFILFYFFPCFRFTCTNSTGGHQPHADSSPGGHTGPSVLTPAEEGLYSGALVGAWAPLAAGAAAAGGLALVGALAWDFGQQNLRPLAMQARARFLSLGWAM